MLVATARSTVEEPRRDAGDSLHVDGALRNQRVAADHGDRYRDILKPLLPLARGHDHIAERVGRLGGLAHVILAGNGGRRGWSLTRVGLSPTMTASDTSPAEPRGSTPSWS